MSSTDEVSKPTDLIPQATVGYWQGRWQTLAIGWHERDVHEHLAAFADSVLLKRRETGDEASIPSVLVPLCGATIDMFYLAQTKGARVIGVEFVPEAVLSFLSAHGFSEDAADEARRYTRRAVHEELDVYTALDGRLTIVRGDIFDARLPEALPEACGGYVDAVWDRAALVALDPKTRETYVKRLVGTLLRDGGVYLLSTFAYPQSVRPGPPWSVDADDVKRLFTPYAAPAAEGAEEDASPFRLLTTAINPVDVARIRVDTVRTELWTFTRRARS